MFRVVVVLAVVATGCAEAVPSDAEPGQLAFDEVEIDGGFSFATAIEFLPGTDEFLLLGLDGLVGHYALEGDRATRLGEFAIPNVYMKLDCGAISIAFDPAFPDNRFLYVGACLDEQRSRIQRLEFDPPAYDRVAASAVEIITVGDPDAARPWHNVGDIGFDPDGTMWALFGDKQVDVNGQDTRNMLGSMIRVVPDRTPAGTGYVVPSDNPFIGENGRAPEVYAFGLRSPWQGVRDSKGRYWIGDVGSNVAEEIDIVAQPGQNFGWADHEGPCRAGCGNATDPSLHWSHDAWGTYALDDPEAIPTERRVAWVGPEYEVGGVDRYAGQLTGRVLFGDMCIGFVRLAELDAVGEVVLDRHLGHLPHTTGWSRAADGHLYAVSLGTCASGRDERPQSRLYRAVLR